MAALAVIVAIVIWYSIGYLVGIGIVIREIGNDDETYAGELFIVGCLFTIWPLVLLIRGFNIIEAYIKRPFKNPFRVRGEGSDRQ